MATMTRKRRRWKLQLKAAFADGVVVAYGAYRRAFVGGEITFHAPGRARLLLRLGYFERVT